MDFEVGDWIETTMKHHYFNIRKGTVGFITGVGEDDASFFPVSHPDGKYVNKSVRTLKKLYFNPLPTELTGDELEAFIDLALKERNKKEFYELVSRRVSNECD